MERARPYIEAVDGWVRGERVGVGKSERRSNARQQDSTRRGDLARGERHTQGPNGD